MEDRKDQLVFVYTLACPLKCDYCCFPSETFGSDKFDTLRAVGIIEEAADLGTVKRIIFSGGEPFLCYDEIKEILSKVHSLGLPAGMVTSAYWAESEKKARAMLSPLSSLGMDEITITTDPSHQEFVHVEMIRYAARAALSLNMRVKIAASFWKTGMDIRPSLDLPSSDSISYSQSLVVPTGRAKQHKVNWKEYGMDCPPAMSEGCRRRERGMDITVFPDGTVYPCCACGFNIEAGLNEGSVYEEALKDIVERAWDNPFIRVMLEGGTIAIYEFCRMKFPELLKMLPKDDDLCTMCQVCVMLNKNFNLREALTPILEYGVKVLDRDNILRLKGMIRDEGNKSELVSENQA